MYESCVVEVMILARGVVIGRHVDLVDSRAPDAHVDIEFCYIATLHKICYHLQVVPSL